MKKNIINSFYLSANLITFTHTVFRVLLILYFSNEFRKTLEIGYIMLADTLPFLILGPLIATIVNKFNRKKIISLTLFIDILVDILTLFMIIEEKYSFLVILLILAVNNFNTSLYSVSESSYFPLIVPSEKLSKYNSSLYFMSSLAYILSPNISYFIVNKRIIISILYIVLSITLLTLINSLIIDEVIVTSNETKSKTSLVSSFTYTLKNPTLTIALIVLIIGNIFDAPLDTVILTKYASENSIEKVGIIMSMSGIGSLLSSVLIGFASKNNKIFTILMRISSVGLSISGLLLLLVDNYFIFILIFLLIYLSMGIRTIYIITLRQIETPKEILGSVNTFFKYVAFGISPISIWFFSQLSKYFSNGNLLRFIGIGFLVAGLVSFISLSPNGKLALKEKS
ncbi:MULTISPECIES: MFS transporter [Streptococcus]|jgi:MFS family permease|uniref:MFS transporter n=1 Tax=Streptococcus TaxID=1301 RepID=UPI000B9A1F93|nr:MULTISPECIES: MFS transporter [Streptococcus]OXT11246.1 hypothetical protein CBI42_10020 [Streptococcus sp. KR]